MGTRNEKLITGNMIIIIVAFKSINIEQKRACRVGGVGRLSARGTRGASPAQAHRRVDEGRGAGRRRGGRDACLRGDASDDVEARRRCRGRRRDLQCGAREDGHARGHEPAEDHGEDPDGLLGDHGFGEPGGLDAGRGRTGADGQARLRRRSGRHHGLRQGPDDHFQVREGTVVVIRLECDVRADVAEAGWVSCRRRL